MKNRIEVRQRKIVKPGGASFVEAVTKAIQMENIPINVTCFFMFTILQTNYT